MRPIDADWFKSSMLDEPTEWMTEDQLVQFRAMIDLAPTVDAAPVRRGRWIDIDSEMYTWKIRCSKCGHERSMMSTGQIYPMYCENCGARMDGKNGNHEKAD